MAKTKIVSKGQHHVFYKDPFLLVLLAVVFSAAAVIFLRSEGPNSLNPIFEPVREVLGLENPDALMQGLNETGAVTDFPEFDQLRDEAKGL